MIEQFLKRLAQTLDQEKIPYMIIGGQAAVIYGRPRFTQDVDITLGVDTDQFEKVLALCRSADLKPRSSEPRQFAEETKVLPAEDPISKLRVDFIFSNTPYERQAMDRTQAVKIAGCPVRFASAEDLVIHKIFADRAIDREDAKAVLLRQGSKLDKAYIKKWLRLLSETAEGGKDLLTVWDQLCQETDKNE